MNLRRSGWGEADPHCQLGICSAGVAADPGTGDVCVANDGTDTVSVISGSARANPELIQEARTQYDTVKGQPVLPGRS
jgi:DNA-binding beta-propeller fold protein YncE